MNKEENNLMKEIKNSQRKIEKARETVDKAARERNANAQELLNRGWSLRKIAAGAGVSAQALHIGVTREKNKN